MTYSKIDRKADKQSRELLCFALYLFDQMATKKFMRAMKIPQQSEAPLLQTEAGADYSLTCAGTESAWSASAHLHR
jgi:hypothetical protein